MWVRPLTLVMLALLDLGVVAMLILQALKGLPMAWNLLLPTLAFNAFGIAVVWAMGRDA